MDKHYVHLQGCFLSIFNIGTLITGESGIGKSDLALSLLDRNHQLIADDIHRFELINGQLIGKSQLNRHFLFTRSLGLLDIVPLFGSAAVKDSYPLQLMINLVKTTFKEVVYPEDLQVTKDFSGSLITCVTIPIICPLNLEVLVETIVKRYLLKNNKQFSSLTTFDELLKQEMEQNQS